MRDETCASAAYRRAGGRLRRVLGASGLVWDAGAACFSGPVGRVTSTGRGYRWLCWLRPDGTTHVNGAYPSAVERDGGLGPDSRGLAASTRCPQPGDSCAHTLPPVPGPVPVPMLAVESAGLVAGGPRLPGMDSAGSACIGFKRSLPCRPASLTRGLSGVVVRSRFRSLTSGRASSASS